jgi:hypothetical protein
MAPVLTPAQTFKGQDLLLEDDLNDDLDAHKEDADIVESVEGSSTQGSFVAGTQAVQSEEKQSTPERVKKDMVFLKDSWANMAELEENEPSPHMESHQSVEGFQLKFSKTQKKAQKRLNQSSKDSYATRSKVNQKPFK